GAISTTGGITTAANGTISLTATRSEERRVGKERRGRWGTEGLTTTGAGNAITLAGAVSSTSGAITATAAGAITENAGGTFGTSGLLTTSSAGGETLNQANTVGSFTATNTGAGNIALIITAAAGTLTGYVPGVGKGVVPNSGAISTRGGITTAANGTISLTAT